MSSQASSNSSNCFVYFLRKYAGLFGLFAAQLKYKLHILQYLMLPYGCELLASARPQWVQLTSVGGFGKLQEGRLLYVV